MTVPNAVVAIPKSAVPTHRVRRSGQVVRVFSAGKQNGVEVKFQNSPMAKFFYQFVIREPSDLGEPAHQITQRALQKMDIELRAIAVGKREEEPSDG